MADWLATEKIATAIGRDARCESACAIAFMGGSHSTESDAGDFPNRVLHPLGKLGFHAPNLVVPEGRYNQSSVSQAYDTALKSIEGILRKSDNLSIRRSLIVEMMSTASNDMYYIETVGEASRWGIAVAPVIERKTLTNADIWRACNNIDGYLLDQPPYHSNYHNSLPTPKFRDDEWEIELEDGFRQELATGCSLVYTVSGSNKQPYDWGGWVRINDLWPLWGYQFYLPETPITRLALQEDQAMEFGPQLDVFKRSQFAGRCYVLKNAKGVDNDLCTMTRDLVYRADFVIEATDIYVWPSTARTVVTSTSNGIAYLNGQLITKSWDDPDEERTKNVVGALALKELQSVGSTGCYRNSQSGNHFCFVDGQGILDSNFSPYVYR